MQRGIEGIIYRINIGASLQQQLDHFEATPSDIGINGMMQGSHARLVLQIDIAPPVQVKGHRFQVPLADIPEKLGFLSAKVDGVDMIIAACPKEDPHKKKETSRGLSYTL
jgi:hypothetical protein